MMNFLSLFFAFLLAATNFAAVNCEYYGAIYQTDKKRTTDKLFVLQHSKYITVDEKHSPPANYDLYTLLNSLLSLEYEGGVFKGIAFTKPFTPLKAIIVVQLTDSMNTDAYPSFNVAPYYLRSRQNIKAYDNVEFLFHKVDANNRAIKYKQHVGIGEEPSGNYRAIHILCPGGNNDLNAIIKNIKALYKDNYLILGYKSDKTFASKELEQQVAENFGSEVIYCYPFILGNEPKMSVREFMTGCRKTQAFLASQRGNSALHCEGKDRRLNRLMTLQEFSLNNVDAAKYNLNTFAEYDQNYSYSMMARIGVMVVFVIIAVSAAILLCQVDASGDATLYKPIAGFDKLKNE